VLDDPWPRTRSKTCKKIGKIRTTMRKNLRCKGITTLLIVLIGTIPISQAMEPESLVGNSSFAQNTNGELTIDIEEQEEGAICYLAKRVGASLVYMSAFGTVIYSMVYVLVYLADQNGDLQHWRELTKN
jgi:hypothetical protein